MTKIKVFIDFDAEELVKKINNSKIDFFATQIFHTKDGWHAFAYYKDERGLNKNDAGN